MSNKNKYHNKKWLITRLKTSGSKRRWVDDGDYSDTRHSKRNKDWENLPTYEGMKESCKFFNGKINYGPLVRFLRRKAGADWNQVYDEIIARIPTNLHEYKDCVRWFVADLVEIRATGIWDKREQKYIKISPDESFNWNYYTLREFYVDPDTNILIRVKDFPSNKKTKGMSAEELRKFRESEQKQKLEEKRLKRSDNKNAAKEAKEILQKKKSDE